MADFSRSAWVMGIAQIVFVIFVMGSAVALSNALRPAESDKPALVDFSASGEPSSVSASIPQKTSYTPQIKINGVIQSQAQADIAPQVSGKVIRVGSQFKPGQSVAAGDLLFEIDPTDFRLAVEQADASVAEATSDLALLRAEAELAVEEWEDVFPGREITDLAAQRPQIAAAEARLNSAIASKKTAQLALSRTKVRAPSDGRVMTAALDVGQILTANQTVGSMFAVGSIEISAALSTSQLARVEPVDARTVTFAVRGNMSDVRQAAVERVDSTLDPRTRLATVYIRPKNGADLTIGDFVDVFISGNELTNAFIVPSSAFVGRDQIWVVSDGLLSSRRVTVLGEQDDETFVAAFDYGDGVVALPPVEAFEGQEVALRTPVTRLVQGKEHAAER